MFPNVVYGLLLCCVFHSIFIYNRSTRCHGLRLSVLNKETTCLLTYLSRDFVLWKSASFMCCAF